MKKLFLAIILSLLSIQIQAQELTKSDSLLSGTDPSSYHENEAPFLKDKNFATALSVSASIGTVFYFRYLGQHHLYNPQAIGAGFAIAFLAPGTGYLYTGNVDVLLIHSLYRVGGFSLFYLGGIMVDRSNGKLFDLSLQNPIWGAMVATAGVGIIIDSVWKDFIGVRKKVDEYNQNLMSRVQISPLVNPLTQTIGLGLRVSF